METIKRRNPWLAAVLSLVCTGLGQLYSGQWKKGALFYFGEMVLGLGLLFCFRTFNLLLVFIGVLLAVNVGVAVEAYRTARTRTKYVLEPFNRVWVYILIVALSIGLGTAMEWTVQASYYQTFKVPSGSMIPTLHIGDHFMAEQLGEGDSIERGDIVVFEVPESGKYFVKRAIGLPGDTIAMRDKVVFINGQPLEEPYTQHTETGMMPDRDTFPQGTLPADGYFLMGDNREASYDSRFIGPIKREAIIARALYLYFPALDDSNWSSRLGTTVR